MICTFCWIFQMIVTIIIILTPQNFWKMRYIYFQETFLRNTRNHSWRKDRKLLQRQVTVNLRTNSSNIHVACHRSRGEGTSSMYLNRKHSGHINRYSPCIQRDPSVFQSTKFSQNYHVPRSEAGLPAGRTRPGSRAYFAFGKEGKNFDAITGDNVRDAFATQLLASTHRARRNIVVGSTESTGRSLESLAINATLHYRRRRSLRSTPLLDCACARPRPVTCANVATLARAI